MVKFGDWRSCHAPPCRLVRDIDDALVCVWRRVRDLMLKIFTPVRSSGSGDPVGMSTRRSKGCWKISLEEFYGDELF